MRVENRKIKQTGFTLIELLIVMAVLGIISAVALPSYLSSVQGGRQGAADSNARAISIAMQARGVLTGSYDSVLSNYAVDLGGVVPVNPCTGTNTGYVITVVGKTSSISALAGTNCGTWTPRTFSMSL
jgi:hypothetical protein